MTHAGAVFLTTDLDLCVLLTPK